MNPLITHDGGYFINCYHVRVNNRTVVVHTLSDNQPNNKERRI